MDEPPHCGHASDFGLWCARPVGGGCGKGKQDDRAVGRCALFRLCQHPTSAKGSGTPASSQLPGSLVERDLLPAVGKDLLPARGLFRCMATGAGWHRSRVPFEPPFSWDFRLPVGLLRFSADVVDTGWRVWLCR